MIRLTLILCSLPLILFFNCLILPAIAQNHRLPPKFDPETRSYVYPQQHNTTGLSDPVYQGNFQLSTGIHVDEKLMNVSQAANDLDFILNQAATNMSSCLKIDEQQQRITNDYKTLDSNRSGKTVANKFRQSEALIKQAKTEFEIYKNNRTRSHDAYDPHLRAGNELLKQARDSLRNTRPIVDLLWRAAQGITEAVKQLANLTNEAPSLPLASKTPVAPSTTFNTPLNNQLKNQDPQKTEQGFTKDDVQHPNLDQKLGVFFDSLKRRMLNKVVDPTERLEIIENLSEKFIGIGEGLTEAKDEVKNSAAAAFVVAVQQTEAFKKDPVGTMEATKKAANAFGTSLANSTIHALDEAAKDSGSFDRLLKTSIVKVAEATENYSSLPAREQGKILGKTLFSSINPSGSLEGGKLAGQAFSRATNVIKPHMAQLNSELNILAATGKEKLLAAQAKLDHLASTMGRSQKPVLAAVGPSMPTGPPRTSALDDLYSLMVKNEGSAGGPGKINRPDITLSAKTKSNFTTTTIKPGTKIGSIVADEMPINEGWALDGQKVSDRLEWPKGWRKPSRGEFLASNGKLYFRPDEAAQAYLQLDKDVLIPFVRGVPDLEAFTIDRATHTYISNPPLTGLHLKDRPLYIRDILNQNKEFRGMKTDQELANWLNSSNHRIHHFHNADKSKDLYQIVRRDVHEFFGHHGPASEMRNKPQ